MTKVLMIIAPTDFKDEEYFTPKKILEENGYAVETASTVNQPTSVAGQTVRADVLLNDVQVGNYEAVVFVGGLGAQVYVDDLAAQNLAKSFYKAGKVVAAICIAPAILAKAGLLQGKQATVFPSAKGILKENGANYTGDAVIVAGKIITGRDPAAAQEFGKKVVEVLK
jgi:protease I